MCKRVKNLAPNLGDTKWIKGWSCHAMLFISSTAFNMVASSATIYRSPSSKIKKMKFLARCNCARMKKASKKKASKKTASKKPLGGSVSPTTAETYGRCLNLSYAEAVKEIYLITQACLRLSEGVDF